MQSLIRFLRQHTLISGIVLMFLLTWPIDLASSKVLPIQLPFAVYILVGYGFVIASLVMTGLTSGTDGIYAILKRFLIWRVSWKWYLVALLMLPGLYLLAVILNSALTQTSPDFSAVFAYKIFGPSANLPILVLPYFLFDALTNGEEIGWRGYVLPRLQSKHSVLASSLILGVIWWFWHLPKFLAPGNTSSFAIYLPEILPLAVLYTWLYNNTRGSLLLATLFHASGNAAGMFLPITNTISNSNIGAFLLFIILETLIAVVVIFSERSPQFSRKERIQIYD